MMTIRSDEVVTGGGEHVVIVPARGVGPHMAREREARRRGLEWDDISCARCESPPNQGCIAVHGIDPEPPPPRALIEAMGAVLHELRRSGPLGLGLGELDERLDASSFGAISELIHEGRAVWRDGRVVLAPNNEVTP